MVVRARKNNNDKFKLEEAIEQERSSRVIYPDDEDDEDDRRATTTTTTTFALTSLVSATDRPHMAHAVCLTL